MAPLSSGKCALCGQTRCDVEQVIRFAPASSSSQTLGKFKLQDLEEGTLCTEYIAICRLVTSRV